MTWWAALPAELQRAIRWAAFFLLLGCVFFIQQCRVERAQDKTRAAGLAVENEKARGDSLHAVQLSAKDSAALQLGDSVAVLSRLVVQRKQERDALDKALGVERQATAKLQLAVRQLEATAVPSSQPVREDSAGTRRASFDIRDAPYTAHADVVLPPGPQATGSLSLSVRLDSAHVEARLSCSDRENEFGVRAAQLSLLAPRWLSVRVDSVSQDSEICQRKAREAQLAGHWWKPQLTFGYGLVAARDGSVRHGLAATLGFSWHPFGR